MSTHMSGTPLPSIPCGARAAGGAQYSPGGPLPAAKGPLSQPIWLHCSLEAAGQARVPRARLHVGAGAPRPLARQLLAHLDITRLSRR